MTPASCEVLAWVTDYQQQGPVAHSRHRTFSTAELKQASHDLDREHGTLTREGTWARKTS